jgi:excisionase family DNA binding protein
MSRRKSATKNIPNPPDWMTVGQVAEHLQVSRVTVWRWIRSGHLSGVRVGRVRRISRSSLSRLVRPGKSAPPRRSRRPLGAVFTLAHPLWELVGKGRGGGANVSGNKYRFVASAFDPR